MHLIRNCCLLIIIEFVIISDTFQLKLISVVARVVRRGKTKIDKHFLNYDLIKVISEVNIIKVSEVFDLC